MKRPIRMWTACIAGIAVLLLLSVGTMGVLLSRDAVKRYRDSVKRELRIAANQASGYVRAAVAPHNSMDRIGDSKTHWKEALGSIRQNFSARVTVVAMDGRVLFDTSTDAALMENHASREEIAQAMKGHTGLSTRHSATTQSERMYLAIPVVVDDQILATVRLSRELKYVNSGVWQVRKTALWVGGAVFILSLALSLIVVRRVVRPLTAITHVAVQQSQGKATKPLELADSSILEIGRLYEVFRAMQIQIAEQLASLQKQQEEKSSLLESLTEGVLAVGPDGTILDANSAIEKLLHTTKNKLLGSHYSGLTEFPELPRLIDQALHQQRTQTIEVNQTLPHPIRLLVTSAPRYNDEEGGIVIVANDITKLKQLEHVRQEFVANVSHELKTPLTTILGFAKALAGPTGETCSPDDRKRHLERIHHDGQRALAIIDDLLLLSQLDSGQAAGILTETTDLTHALQRALQANRPAAQAKGIEVVLDAEEGMQALVTGNGALLELAIDNLLRNAMTYTPPEGKVTIRLESQEDPLTGQPSWRIDVADTGCGIAPRHHQAVFHRFFRVDASRSREQGGTGLGLALVKHIVQAHKGRVQLESQQGQGATFSLFIPNRKRNA